MRVDVRGSGVANAPSEHVASVEHGDIAASGDPLAVAPALLFRSSTATGVPVGFSVASAVAVGGGSRTALWAVTGFLYEQHVGLDACHASCSSTVLCLQALAGISTFRLSPQLLRTVPPSPQRALVPTTQAALQCSPHRIPDLCQGGLPEM